MRPLDNIPDPNQGAKLDPYELRTIGEKAARLYLNGGRTLDDSVVSAIKETMVKLNNHHVQRVVEHANLRAFRELRQRAGGVGTAVEFDGGPASTISVLEKLNGSSRSKEVPMISQTEVPTKEASLLLRKARGIVSDQMAKVASADRTLTEREEMDTVDLYVKLGEAVRECRTSAAILEEKRASIGGEICRYAGQVLRDGGTLGDIHRILSAAGGDHHELVKAAMNSVVSYACPRFGLMGDSMDESMEKISSRNPPNPGHPLFRWMEEFVKVSEELVNKRGAAEILASGRARLRTVLHQQ